MRCFPRLWPLLLLVLGGTAPAAAQMPTPVNHPFEWHPSMLTVHDGELYFRMYTASGLVLGSYDSSLDRVRIASPISPYAGSPAANMASFNGKLFFGAQDPESSQFMLAAYDDELESVAYHTVFNGGPPVSLTPFDGDLYFISRLTVPINGSWFGGREIWVYDGTSSQAVPVTMLFPGILGLSPRSLVEYAGRLYFSAEDTPLQGVGSGAELWAYDPSTGTAALVADVAPGATGSSPDNLTVYDGRLFFTASGDPADRFDLWAYDAATGSAEEVADVHAPNHAAPHSLTVYDGRLFFVADDAEASAELWAYDAVTDTARRVVDIWPGPNPSFSQGLTVYDGLLYFSANDGVHGPELWSFDGRTETARLVADLIPDGGSYPAGLTVYADRLFFSAYGTEFGDFLWYLETTTTASGAGPSPLSERFTLSPARPNPFASSSTLTLTVRESQHVHVEALDVLGRSVAVIYDGLARANHPEAIRLNAAELKEGTYLVRATGEHFSATRLVTVQR